MNGCHETRELLPWYANGSLSIDEARTVAAHLVGCEACRDELATTLLLNAELGHIFKALPASSDDVRRRVAERTHGKNLANLNVGSFLLGFSLGASIRQRSIPIRGDLRLMGRRIPLFTTQKGGRSE